MPNTSAAIPKIVINPGARGGQHKTLNQWVVDWIAQHTWVCPHCMKQTIILFTPKYMPECRKCGPDWPGQGHPLKQLILFDSPEAASPEAFQKFRRYYYSENGKLFDTWEAAQKENVKNNAPWFLREKIIQPQTEEDLIRISNQRKELAEYLIDELKKRNSASYGEKQ